MGYSLNDGGPFTLDTDASGSEMGAVLSQIQSGRDKVLSYGSRSWSKAEKNFV
ncbi:hypothetical protein DPMN_165967 [Dreissena polymorpha]|uniref:Reverse transcriptase/retrotransposon-derived protein RNase H-like domain-containing protein n=1 Tax=Dreissena polymorpha TaxID=45954 RepID=A0A9D4EXV1_DREPO|nr:hypothetical protein DPMN_165967 [Dreissena polymorpha]